MELNMAKKTTSGLAGKLGAKLAKAVDAKKGEETKFDTGGNLPPGICRPLRERPAPLGAPPPNQSAPPPQPPFHLVSTPQPC